MFREEFIEAVKSDIELLKGIYTEWFERDKSGIDRAECRDVFYEKGNPPVFDVRTVTDCELKKREGDVGVTIIDMKSEDNKYLHRDFHILADKCPVIEYMHSLGQEPSAYFVEETRTLYDEVAKQCGFNFELEYYNADGGAKFVFCKWRKKCFIFIKSHQTA